MSYSVGDICYIVTECDSPSQFEDFAEYHSLAYAESIKVVQVKVTAVEGIPVVRNGRTRMEYQIEAVHSGYRSAVLRSGSGSSRKRVWYEYSLFPTPEAAEVKRREQLEKHLGEVEAEFNAQLNGIRNLIKPS